MGAGAHRMEVDQEALEAARAEMVVARIDAVTALELDMARLGPGRRSAKLRTSIAVSGACSLGKCAVVGDPGVGRFKAVMEICWGLPAE